jgi:hypothetical protein
VAEPATTTPPWRRQGNRAWHPLNLPRLSTGPTVALERGRARRRRVVSFDTALRRRGATPLAGPRGPRSISSCASTSRASSRPCVSSAGKTSPATWSKSCGAIFAAAWAAMCRAPPVRPPPRCTDRGGPHPCRGDRALAEAEGDCAWHARRRDRLGHLRATLRLHPWKLRALPRRRARWRIHAKSRSQPGAPARCCPMAASPTAFASPVATARLTWCFRRCIF